MSGLGDSYAFPLPIAGDGRDGIYNVAEQSAGKDCGMTYRQYLFARLLPGIAADSGLTPEEGFALAASWVDAWIAAMEEPAAPKFGIPGLDRQVAAADAAQARGEPAAKPELKPRSALDVWCPTCHEAPGSGCRDIDGRTYTLPDVHPARAKMVAPPKP